MIRFVIAGTIVLFSLPVFCQGNINQFVVEYSGKNLTSLIDKLSDKISDRNKSLAKIHPFSPLPTNTFYTVTVDSVSFPQWKKLLEQQREILNLEVTTETEKRTTVPNDPRLTEQWYLQNIKAYEAWSVTSGGLNAKGKEVVIAVIDDGFEVGHEDFKDIFFLNKKEIPNDGIDNDGNGFIDDYAGYNIKTNNGNITSERHGTNVIGVLGARGNNNIGIAGINWNVKILPIVIPSTNVGVEKAMDYILAMRKLYDATKGEKGAYIVAATYSGGISKRFGTEFPVWCGLYNKLGEAGIMSIGATTNNNDDVDKVGDVPSTCGSDYLIVVTNSNSRDVKVRDAGYGKIHVDLAVPGDNILTTNNTGLKYGYENGTSLSAPILAGAISLIFTVECEAFQNRYETNPAATALELKSMILNSGDDAFYLKSGVNAPLKEITTSGKRLNIYNALDSLRTRYSDCIPNFDAPKPLSIESIIMVDGQGYVTYNTPAKDEISVIFFDALGRLISTNKLIPEKTAVNTWSFNMDSVQGFGNMGLSQVYFIGFVQGKQKAAKSFYHFRS